MDEFVELSKKELKELLFAAWRNGSIGSDTSLEDDKSAFEEWYENGEWITE